MGKSVLDSVAGFVVNRLLAINHLGIKLRTADLKRQHNPLVHHGKQRKQC